MSLPATLRSHLTGDPEPAAPVPVPVPVPVPEPQPPRRFDRARAEAEARPGSLRHSATHGVPSSLAAHQHYVKSRAWVPAGKERGFADREGALWYALIGNTLHRAGLLLAWVGDRQYRAWVALVIITPVLPLLSWLLWLALRLVYGP